MLKPLSLLTFSNWCIYWPPLNNPLDFQECCNQIINIYVCKIHISFIYDILCGNSFVTKQSIFCCSWWLLSEGQKYCLRPMWLVDLLFQMLFWLAFCIVIFLGYVKHCEQTTQMDLFWIIIRSCVIAREMTKVHEEVLQRSLVINVENFLGIINLAILWPYNCEYLFHERFLTFIHTSMDKLAIK